MGDGGPCVFMVLFIVVWWCVFRVGPPARRRGRRGGGRRVRQASPEARQSPPRLRRAPVRSGRLDDQGQMNVDLSLDAVLFSRGGQWRGSRGEPPRGGGPDGGFVQGPPPGYCFAYHRRGFCSLASCSWKHTCPQCGARHPSKACQTSFPGRRAQVDSAGGAAVAGKQLRRDGGPGPR